MTNSVGLMKIFATSQLHDAFILSSVPTSALQSTRQFAMDENDLKSSQFGREMASNRCVFASSQFIAVEISVVEYCSSAIKYMSSAITNTS